MWLPSQDEMLKGSYIDVMRYQILDKSGDAAGFLVATAASQAVRVLLERDGADAGTILVLFLIVIIVGFILIKFVVDAFLDGARVRRIVLGQTYVEGVYIDEVTFRNQARDRMFGLVFIEREHRSLKYRGENLDSHGKPLGEFHSEWVAFAYPQLTYSFSGGLPVRQGYGFVTFAGNSFTSWFYERTEHSECGVRGVKIVDEEALRQVRRGGAAQQLKLHELIGEHFGGPPSTVPAPVVNRS